MLQLRPTHFPYTTLFRSHSGRVEGKQPLRHLVLGSGCTCGVRLRHDARKRAGFSAAQVLRNPKQQAIAQAARSEEHTSELQSHVNLVCRLLLEKKKPRPI